jgi:hypothetical protein
MHEVDNCSGGRVACEQSVAAVPDRRVIESGVRPCRVIAAMFFRPDYYAMPPPKATFDRAR